MGEITRTKWVVLGVLKNMGAGSQIEICVTNILRLQFRSFQFIILSLIFFLPEGLMSQIYYNPDPTPKKSNRTLITCGIIGVVAVCIGVMVLAGVLGASFFYGEEQNLALAITAPPPVAANQSFKIIVNLNNSGNSALTINEVQLPKAILRGAELTGITPNSSGASDHSDAVGYKFDLSIPAGKSEPITFAFKATQPGDYNGDIKVTVGSHSNTAAVRVLVNTAAAQAPTTASNQAPTPEASRPTLAPTEPVSSLGNVPYKGVVQIIAYVDVNGTTRPGWTGSGTIVTADGLILTNGHVVLSDRYYKVQYLVVAMTTAQDQPPEPRYKMELLQVDQKMDIAVGRISTDLDDNPIDASKLNLPVVPLGDSDALKLGDSLTIIGYPGIGGETITLTRGDVSGFTAEAPYGNRAFIKTSATIAGGNSGGLASDSTGHLIGIPTQLGYGGDGQYIDCRVLADTNRDGVVDDKDTCVPTGGFINALRPITLARPFIEAAERGEVNINTGAVTQVENTPVPQANAPLYKDDFSDPKSGWPDEDDSHSMVGYKNGEYLINIKPAKYISWSTIGGEYTDAIIQVDTRIVKNTDQGDYGIICRYQDAQNFYGVEISEDGYFTIWKYVDDKLTSLYDWEASDSITPGEPVTITASCIGNKIGIAVNDKILATVEDDSFQSGNVGLIAGTYDTPDLTLAFDNFSVYKP
jgi:S1-C subfamily serine protease